MAATVSPPPASENGCAVGNGVGSTLVRFQTSPIPKHPNRSRFHKMVFWRFSSRIGKLLAVSGPYVRIISFSVTSEIFLRMWQRGFQRTRRQPRRQPASGNFFFSQKNAGRRMSLAASISVLAQTCLPVACSRQKGVCYAAAHNNVVTDFFRALSTSSW